MVEHVQGAKWTDVFQEESLDQHQGILAHKG
jgi:hypothetical protein